ncbi:hypothetical protein SDC9_185785 [bioreactor metagenome]|uniref:Uncharacterized protein n=1 Tax=bioreactor metagenome TaxID=1076179 RepID=A0A645HGW2_9ZZZZ
MVNGRETIIFENDILSNIVKRIGYIHHSGLIRSERTVRAVVPIYQNIGHLGRSTPVRIGYSQLQWLIFALVFDSESTRTVYGRG